jgi:hypothetical protein
MEEADLFEIKYGVISWRTIIFIIMSRVLVTETGFGLVIGFINNPQVLATINSYTVTDLHTLKSLHTNLLNLSAIVSKHSCCC